MRIPTEEPNVVPQYLAEKALPRYTGNILGSKATKAVNAIVAPTPSKSRVRITRPTNKPLDLI